MIRTAFILLVGTLGAAIGLFAGTVMGEATATKTFNETWTKRLLAESLACHDGERRAGQLSPGCGRIDELTKLRLTR